MEQTSSLPVKIVKNILQACLLLCLIYFECIAALGLVVFYIFAVFIKSLRRPLNRGIGFLFTKIESQYLDIINMMTYEGENIVLKIISAIFQTIFYLFSLCFKAYAILYLFALLFYSLFFKHLRPVLVNSISSLYTGSGYQFNRMTRGIAFNEDTNFVLKVISIICQIVFHLFAAFTLFWSALYLACLFIYWIFFKVILRPCAMHAISRMFARMCKHLTAILILCQGRQPDDIEIEEDVDVYLDEESAEESEAIIHYRKDGQPDMRYRENRNR